jgi:hypothetical protein
LLFSDFERLTKSIKIVNQKIKKMPTKKKAAKKVVKKVAKKKK